ncbi:BnaA05g30380D [Brassica napus]|uniref:(rape) hypothetical protein n=1 Tax=Brassica napus TaxID=3708 RepID=A0A078GH77_BRANA|nr:unnamed protein product [Brassica napus]CDY24639.1 BnaA05g30380D [Brassica napus]
MNPTCIYRSDPLAPVTKALAPIANISVESQVLYHTSKSSFSSWNEKLQSYILNELSSFVRTFFSKIPMTNLDITDTCQVRFTIHIHNILYINYMLINILIFLKKKIEFLYLLKFSWGKFRQSFGFKSEAIYTSGLGSSKILPMLSFWIFAFELDVTTCFNLHFCATTLGSLSRLSSLPRMIIKDEIGEQICFSS